MVLLLVLHVVVVAAVVGDVVAGDQFVIQWYCDDHLTSCDGLDCGVETVSA